MKVVVDNQEVKGKESYGNLQEILQNISEEQLSDNRMVWSVKLNGTDYCEQSPHDAVNVKTGDIKTLEIGTMDDTEICESFMQNGGAIVDCLCKGTEKVSQLFRMDDGEEANKHYSNLLDSCQGFFAMLHHSEEVLKIDWTISGGQGGSLGKKIVSADQLFDTMYKAQKDEDWINLADLLEYELSPLLEEYKEIVAAAA